MNEFDPICDIWPNMQYLTKYVIFEQICGWPTPHSGHSNSNRASPRLWVMCPCSCTQLIITFVLARMLFLLYTVMTTSFAVWYHSNRHGAVIADAWVNNLMVTITDTIKSSYFIYWTTITMDWKYFFINKWTNRFSPRVFATGAPLLTEKRLKISGFSIAAWPELASFVEDGDSVVIPALLLCATAVVRLQMYSLLLTIHHPSKFIYINTLKPKAMYT